jgi:hypothetical protein
VYCDPVPAEISNVHWKQNRVFTIFVYLLIGASSYGLVTQFNGLWPTDINWLNQFRLGYGDSTANYLGWEFFRKTDFWQSPLGQISNLGPPGGSSVALTDSLPLIAIPLKYLTFWIDTPFQYFGIWILANFLLQAYFAGKLLSFWIESPWVIVPAIFFFSLAPIFVNRIPVNIPLASHWLILAALMYFFDSQFSQIKWLLLGSVSLLIHPYLSFIVAILYLGRTFVASMVLKNCKIKIFGYVILYFVVMLFLAYQSGLFVFGSGSVGAGGFGDYSTNLFSLFDPKSSNGNAFTPNWSSLGLIKNFSDADYQYEGFAYVGTGSLILILLLLLFRTNSAGRKSHRKTKIIFLAACLSTLILVTDNETSIGIILISIFSLMVYATCTKSKLIDKEFGYPFLAVISLLFFLAVSNIVYIGSSSFEVGYPSLLVSAMGTFRASGRFIWVVMYAIVFITLIELNARIKNISLLAAILWLALSIQVIESSDAFSDSKKFLMDHEIKKSLDSPLWNIIGEKYDRFEIVAPKQMPQILQTVPYHKDFWWFDGILWSDLGSFASENKMGITAFLFARSPDRSYSIRRLQLSNEIFSGTFDSNAAYVFVDPYLWDLALASKKESDIAGLLDGVPILLPNLGLCRYCPEMGLIPPTSSN